MSRLIKDKPVSLEYKGAQMDKFTMINRNFIITCILIGMPIVLTACGGGGSSGGSTPSTLDSSPAPAPIALSMALPELPVFNELSEYIIELDVAYNGSASITYSIDSVSPFVQFTNEGNLIIVKTDELIDMGNTLSFSVVVTAGSLSETVSVDELLINQSLVNAFERSNELLVKASSYQYEGMQELVSIHSYLIEQAYLLGNIAFSEKASMLEGVVRVAQPEFNALSHSISELNYLLDKFNDESLTDSEAINYLSQFDRDLKSSVVNIAQFNSYYDNFNMYDLAIPVITVAIDTDILSLFKGNESMGSFAPDGKWEYSQEYQYINLLIGESAMTCQAEGQ
jgi:hypothetical protein